MMRRREESKLVLVGDWLQILESHFLSVVVLVLKFGERGWNLKWESMIQFCVRLYMHANNLFITNYQRCTHTQYNWINIQQINTLLYGAARRETRKSPKTPKTETLPNKETSIFNLTGHMKPVSKNIYLFDTPPQHNTVALF